MLPWDLSPEIITIIMFGGVLFTIFIGLPIAFGLTTLSVVVGLALVGPGVLEIFRIGIFGLSTSYGFLAIPLFIFMGNMVEKTGIAKRMFDALYILMGNIPGGLAIAVVIIGTILAACVGVIAASIIMLGLIGIPVMLEKGYDKRLISGAICASGNLGILIPPSIMIVMWGPTASLSVGKLFMGAFMPGLLLSALYIAYIYISCLMKPSLGPPAKTAEMNLGWNRKLTMLANSLVHQLLLIFSVLGSILFGIASPTEAAAVGALASLLLAVGYRALNKKQLKDVLGATLRTIGMVMGIAYGAKMFTSLFLQLQCGDVISDLFLGIPGGRWVIFFVIMVVFFIMGMFIDWMGIIFIMVPIITPLGTELGFDPIWFAIMMMVNLQLSFITPPIAYAIFFLKGILKPEWGITMEDIIIGILPYLALISIALILCALFPGIILWLPSRMF